MSYSYQRLNGPFEPDFTVCKKEGEPTVCPPKYVKEFGGNFGDAAAVAAAERELAAATTAMTAPTCTQGPVGGLPAVVCNPALSKAVETAAKKLEAAQGGGSKMLLFAVLAIVGIGGFFWWKNK